MRIVKSEPLADDVEISYGDKLYIDDKYVEICEKEDDDDDSSIEHEFDTVGEMRSHLGIKKEVKICFMEIDWTPQESTLEKELRERLKEKEG